MDIKIKKHLLLYKDHKLKCSIGKSGIYKSKSLQIDELSDNISEDSMSGESFISCASDIDSGNVCDISNKGLNNIILPDAEDP